MSCLYKRADSKYYWWTARYKGRRLRKSTKMTQKHLARKVQEHWNLSMMTGDIGFLELANQTSLDIRSFTDHFLSLRARRSENTYAISKGVMKKFRNYLAERDVNQIDEITVKVLDGFIDWLQCSPKTKKNHIIELSLMFDQAIKEGLNNSNPAKLVTLPRIVKQEKHRPFDSVDLKIIFESAGSWSFYFSMLYYTGLRAGDVALLKYRNIDRKKRSIVSLVRKSRRIHEFPLSAALLKQIPKGYSDDPIFPELYSDSDRKLNDNLAKPRRYLQALLKAQDRRKATLHSFRTTFNNTLRDLGLSIEDRQILLAHSASETTKIYTHPNFGLALEFIDKIPVFSNQNQNVTKT